MFSLYEEWRKQLTYRAEYLWIDGAEPTAEIRSKTKIQSENLISKVWSGNENMAKTFWLYCIIFGVIVGVGAGAMSALYGNYFYIIAKKATGSICNNLYRKLLLLYSNHKARLSHLAVISLY